MSETVTRAAMNEDWELLLSFFPDNWQDLAAETGALRGLRKDKSPESLLRTLLIHLGCGHSLRETVVRTRKANLADLSDVALLKRLRKSRGWLYALCVELFREHGVAISAFDATTVQEPGRTGSLWRIHYKMWADHANQALARVGSKERITGANLEQQHRDALEAGNEREATRLEYRELGVHIGPHNVARAERGVKLERTATARAVEDLNQEFKSDRADVREMEGSLERLRGDIAEIAKKLAVYVRARFGRSRGRSGPDRGWSR